MLINKYCLFKNKNKKKTTDTKLLQTLFSIYYIYCYLMKKKRTLKLFILFKTYIENELEIKL